MHDVQKRSVLQIAYDPALLEIRQIMLEKSGYQVHSALGNDNCGPSIQLEYVDPCHSRRIAFRRCAASSRTGIDPSEPF